MSAAGRFPPLARSRLFGSPLQLRFPRFARPGAAPLERGVGRFGLQHMGSAISPLRFGLGPLMAGLGLSPGPSAVTAPGAVPTGRAVARGRGGLPDVQTLLGRGDFDTLQRLLEQGLLDPRAVPPGVLAALGPAVTSARLPPPPAPRVTPQAAAIIRQAADESGGDARTVLAVARQTLGVSNQVLNDQSLLRQVIDPILNAPPSSFEMPPATRTAVEAQRLGEREPFGAGIVPPGLSVEAARTLEGALGPLSPEEAALLTPEDIAQLEGLAQDIAGGVLPGVLPAIPTDVTAGIEAGVFPAEAGGGATGAIPGGQSLLGAIGPALQIASGGLRLAQGDTIPGALSVGTGAAALAAPSLGIAAPVVSGVGQIASSAYGLATAKTDLDRALNAASLVLAPFTGGLSMAIPLVGKLFAGKPDIPHGVRESIELASRIAPETKGFLSAIQQAPDFPSLYETLVRHSSGSVGGTSGRAFGMGFRVPEERLRRLAASGDIVMPSGMTVDDAVQFWSNQFPEGLQVGPGNPNPTYPVFTEQGFARAFEESPDRFFVNTQAGIAQEKLAPFNEALRRGLSGHIQILNTPGGPEFLRAQAAERQAAAEQIPPSPAEPPPFQPTGELPPVQPGEPPLTVHGGGPITRTGLYRLQAGEFVLPAPPETIPMAKEGHTYVPLDGGPPERARKNPDPARYWRVAQDAAEAQEALRSGDVAELPILADPGVLTLGPRKRGAALEFLRRAQHQNPAGTLGDVLAFSGEQERNILEDMNERLREMEEASRETGVFPTQPYIAPPMVPPQLPNFPMPRAFPGPSRPARM